jgi:hypothetical protein
MIRTIWLPTGAEALPPSVRERLESSPDPGTGVHPWLYSTALAMLNFISAEECVDLLHDHIPRKPKPRNEIEVQVQAALQTKENGQTVSFNRRPEFPAMAENTPRAVLNLARVGKGIDFLRGLSPVQKRETISPPEALNVLCPGNPLVCAGQYFNRPFTAPLSEFHPRFLARCSFVVPNPMTALKGFAPTSGRESARSENNVGPRRWAVIEADIKMDNEKWAPIIIEARRQGLSVQDLGAALLLAVSEESGIPLTAVVHSGAVSLHGWFFAEAARQEQLYWIGAKWGADLATWSRHQWVRMPNGMRWEEDPDRARPATLIGPQRLEYFNYNYKNNKN